MPEERDQENLVECPECEGRDTEKVCDFCKGQKQVPRSVAEGRKRQIELAEEREDRRRFEPS